MKICVGHDHQEAWSRGFSRSAVWRWAKRPGWIQRSSLMCWFWTLMPKKTAFPLPSKPQPILTPDHFSWLPKVKPKMWWKALDWWNDYCESLFCMEEANSVPDQSPNWIDFGFDKINPIGSCDLQLSRFIPTRQLLMFEKRGSTWRREASPASNFC